VEIQRLKTRGRILLASRVGKERAKPVRRVFTTGIVIERSITRSCVVVAGNVEVERLFANSRVKAAGCVIEERIKADCSVVATARKVEQGILAFSSGSVGVASVRWRINCQHCGRKRNTGENEAHEKRATLPR